MATTPTPVLSVSVPTKIQFIHGIERVIAVFLIASFGAWQVVPDKFSKAAGVAGILAGFTAVYQLVVSTLTTLQFPDERKKKRPIQVSF